MWVGDWKDLYTLCQTVPCSISKSNVEHFFHLFFLVRVDLGFFFPPSFPDTSPDFLIHSSFWLLRKACMFSMDNTCLCYLMAGIVGLLFQKHQMIQAWKSEDKEHIRGNSSPMWCAWQSCCAKKQRYGAFFFSLKGFTYSNTQQCLGLNILIFFNNEEWKGFFLL